MRKIIIIGFGPAGTSAAIYLKRAGFHPIVIGKDYGALTNYPEKIENYYGFSEPILGQSLIKNGVKQAKKIGIEIIHDSVISLDQEDGFFYVKTTTSNFIAKAVVLATGKKRDTLSLPGFNKFKGKGISLCATCDGYFFRRKKIALIGYGPYMINELEVLTRINKDIVIFSHNHDLSQEVDFPVVNKEIKSFLGDNRLSHIETVDGKRHHVDGAFIAIGAPSSLEFAAKLGVILENENIVVDSTYQTNIEGLFAIGDVIGGKLQISKAVYDGMMVSDSIKKYLDKIITKKAR